MHLFACYHIRFSLFQAGKAGSFPMAFQVQSRTAGAHGPCPDAFRSPAVMMHTAGHKPPLSWAHVHPLPGNAAPSNPPGTQPDPQRPSPRHHQSTQPTYPFVPGPRLTSPRALDRNRRCPPPRPTRTLNPNSGPTCLPLGNSTADITFLPIHLQPSISSFTSRPCSGDSRAPPNPPTHYFQLSLGTHRNTPFHRKGRAQRPLRRREPAHFRSFGGLAGF